MLIFGGQVYATMWLAHGNPVWPVSIRVGPWVLPGRHSVEELLAAGAAVPRAEGSLLERITLSWLAIDTNPVFDMRLGGFGLLFLLALPFAVLRLVELLSRPVVPSRAAHASKGLLLLMALTTALLTPDPATTRYVLAVAALVFATAAASVSMLRWRPSARVAVGALVLLVAGAQVVWAAPGLFGDGPALTELLRMSDEERRVAIGPNGRPIEYPATWAHVRRDESVAFDEAFEFPGLLWSPELRYPVRYVPEGSADLASWLESNQVRVVAVGPVNAAALRAKGRARWSKLFDCSSSDCAVYVRE